LNRLRHILLRLLPLVCGVGICVHCYGQWDTTSRSYAFPHSYSRKDSNRVFLYFVQATGCKSFFIDSMTLIDSRTENALALKTRSGRGGVTRKNLLTLHGNISYDFDYWSNIDTPYAESNINQQTVQTYIDLNYKNEYPFRVVFTTRWSNSSLFRNITDVSFQYNAGQFNNQVKRQALGLLAAENKERDSLLRMEKQLAVKEKEFNSLNGLVKGPSRDEWLIVQRELQFWKSHDTSRRQNALIDSAHLPNLDGLRRYKFGGDIGSRPSDTSGKKASTYPDSTYLLRYDSLRKRADSLGKELDSLVRQYKKLQEAGNVANRNSQRELQSITRGTQLKEKLDDLHLPDSSLPKGYKTLYSIRSFGIGRSLLNYSELSAKNVNINGIQVEYNPSSYMAFAAGTVDYRFRDYTVGDATKGQYIALMRYGWGKKDGNNLIFTYYTGKRQLYNVNTTTTGSPVPDYSLMGFTLQGCYRLGKTTALIAEVAKSSLPYYILDSSQEHSVLASALKMNDRSNEAYSLKINSFIPSSQTKLSATYSRFGANFQSFSLFTTGNRQTAWAVKVDQPFFKKRLLVTGSIRTNDFLNPLLTTAYSSTAVFGSIQATMRLKNWPTVSIGYFPSSQIVKLSNSQYQENLFYTISGSISEAYKTKGIQMMSLLLYTRFYNKITDTGFIYFNTQNFLLSQTALVGRLSIQLQGSIAANASYTLYVVDGKADYRLLSWLSVGAGIKYNMQTVYDIRQWGYSANAAVGVPKLGDFRLMGDKGFIPGNNKRLVQNNLGRLTYTKVF
jgi:hypothetical protein